MNIRPGNIIFDMDEVLFNISPFIYKKIRLNWPIFSPFFKDLGPLTEKEILNREYFSVTDWLLKDNLELSEEKLEELKKELYKKIKDLCFNENLYANLAPTPLAEKTLLNRNFLENSSIESCIILTRYPTSCPGMKIGKEKIVEKYFKHPKIKLVCVNSDEKKSDALKELGVNWSLVIDDELKNIRDIAENFNLERREFLLPKTGYNKLPPELRLLIIEKGGSINYYET